MSNFDDLKSALAQAGNNTEYAQARAKDLIERLGRILTLIEEAKGILCFKDMEEDFDKLLDDYKKKEQERMLTDD